MRVRLLSSQPYEKGKPNLTELKGDEVRRNPVTCAGETAKALASNPRRAAPPALQSIEKP